MRITNKMMSNNFLADMKVNLENLNKIQEQNTSGKKFKRPSDDPFAVARSMQLHSDINVNKQYSKDITDVSNWLDTTDTALGQAGDVLQRVRELLISSGNGAYGPAERRAIKDEINEKVGELGQILNTSFEGNYIFGGTRSTKKPMSVSEDKTSKNNVLGYDDDSKKAQIQSKLKVQVAQGVTMDYNVSASDVLEFDGNKLDDVLKHITNHLDGKNEDGTADDSTAKDKLINGDLKNITDAINNVLKIRSEVGARQNRMEGASERNKDGTFNMTKILSKHEDVNYTEGMTNFATTLSVYMASLQTSAKIIQPTLMDYLR